MSGTHTFQQDERNTQIKIYVNGEIVPRDEAKVSVFDSGFLLGDGLWESFRFHNGTLLFAAEHMKRLHENVKAMDIPLEMSNTEILDAIHATLAANNMTTGVHIRLVLSRGVKITPYQDPRVTLAPPTLVIIPEYKAATGASDPLRLYTVYVRRGEPDVLDPKLHPLSKLNCILACIQATKAGADEALMLDPRGFVAACNSTSFFVVKDGEVWTSSGAHCLHGITRGNIIKLCRQEGIPVYEKDFSLVDVYCADEAFVTGTFGGVKPVSEVDGRTIGSGERPMMQRLAACYEALIESQCR